MYHIEQNFEKVRLGPLNWDWEKFDKRTRQVDHVYTNSSVIFKLVYPIEYVLYSYNIITYDGPSIL